MAVDLKVVVFEVGETLVDETAIWGSAPDAAGPWGHLHEPRAGSSRIAGLDELP